MSTVLPIGKEFKSFEGNNCKHSTFIPTILNQILSFPFNKDNNRNNNTIISGSGNESTNDLFSTGQLGYLTSLYDIYILGDTVADRVGCGGAVEQDRKREEAQPEPTDVLQTIIGGFAALFAVLVSSLGSVIGDIIDYINGYKVLAISNRLFTRGIGICFIMVCRFITAICGASLSSIHGLISGFNDFATATGTYTPHNNGFIGNDKKAPASSATTTNENGSGPRDGTIIAIIGGYFSIVDGYFQAALSTITVVRIEIGFNNSLINNPLIGESSDAPIYNN